MRFGFAGTVPPLQWPRYGSPRLGVGGGVKLGLSLRQRRCPPACVTLPHRHDRVPTFGCLFSQPPRLLTIPEPGQGAGEREILPCLCVSVARTPGVGGGGWHKGSVFGCLPLAAPIGLSPLLILTLCGPEHVLVASTEPLDDLSCLTTPGVGCPGDGLLPWGGGSRHRVRYSGTPLFFSSGAVVLPWAGGGGCVCLVLRAPAAGRGCPTTRLRGESVGQGTCGFLQPTTEPE